MKRKSKAPRVPFSQTRHSNFRKSLKHSRRPTRDRKCQKFFQSNYRRRSNVRNRRNRENSRTKMPVIPLDFSSFYRNINQYSMDWRPKQRHPKRTGQISENRSFQRKRKNKFNIRLSCGKRVGGSKFNNRSLLKDNYNKLKHHKKRISMPKRNNRSQLKALKKRNPKMNLKNKLKSKNKKGKLKMKLKKKQNPDLEIKGKQDFMDLGLKEMAKLIANLNVENLHETKYQFLKKIFEVSGRHQQERISRAAEAKMGRNHHSNQRKRRLLNNRPRSKLPQNQNLNSKLRNLREKEKKKANQNNHYLKLFYRKKTTCNKENDIQHLNNLNNITLSMLSSLNEDIRQSNSNPRNLKPRSFYEDKIKINGQLHTAQLAALLKQREAQNRGQYPLTRRAGILLYSTLSKSQTSNSLISDTMSSKQHRNPKLRKLQNKTSLRVSQNSEAYFSSRTNSSQISVKIGKNVFNVCSCEKKRSKNTSIVKSVLKVSEKVKNVTSINKNTINF